MSKIVKGLAIARQANNVISYGMNVKNMVRDAHNFYKEKFEYTAVLDPEAYIYDDVLMWLNEMVESRRIAFQSTRSGGVRRLYDGMNVAKFNLDGHPISVEVVVPEGGPQIISDPEYANMSSGGKKLTFYSKSLAGINALEEKFVEFTEAKALMPERPNYYTVGKWGWESISVAPRKLESVFLPRGVKENFIADIDEFFKNEQRFIRMGLPWSRGYMFYGPPGNGKSSIIKALVHDYNLSLYNLQLSAIPDDMTLGSLFGNLSKRSVLLFEDIDIHTATMKRESNDKGPTLAGLLNGLDGINTPHGLITVMNTNKKDSLDAALIRAGRVDKQYELSSPDDEQVRNMFAYIYEEPLAVKPGRFNSMAQFTEIFKSNPNDAEAARIAIRESAVPDYSSL